MSNTPTEESFLKDVANHQMEVIRDDGMYRHVRFRQPGSSCYLFDLITWPGYLCYVGDMGSYVFSRLPDMFQFFRTDRKNRHLKNGQTLGINLGYWAEKVQAMDKNDGINEFDEDKFNRVIVERTVNWIRERREETTKDDRRELWEAVMSQVVGADGDSGGYRQKVAAYDFYYQVNSKVKFQFDDLWESNFDRYTYRFVWCCYALAWGILQYDNAKEAVAC